jgi:hypothetical protein
MCTTKHDREGRALKSPLVRIVQGSQVYRGSGRQGGGGGSRRATPKDACNGGVNAHARVRREGEGVHTPCTYTYVQLSLGVRVPLRFVPPFFTVFHSDMSVCVSYKYI